MFIDNAILLSYLTTICTEAVAVLIIQKFKNISKWLLSVILINSFTHPIAIYLLKFLNFNYFLTEFGVFIIELLFYHYVTKMWWKKAFVVSLLANTSSIVGGIIIRSVFS